MFTTDKYRTESCACLAIPDVILEHKGLPEGLDTTSPVDVEVLINVGAGYSTAMKIQRMDTFLVTWSQ